MQIDEPALVLELPQEYWNAFKPAYDALQGQLKLLLTTYFDSIGHNLDTLRTLPVQGLHVDLVAGHDDIAVLDQALPKEWLLLLGVINDRNVWRADLSSCSNRLQPLVGRRPLWIGTSCPLAAKPDRSQCRKPLRRGSEKLVRLRVAEMRRIGAAKLGTERCCWHGKKAELDAYSAPIRARRQSSCVHNAQVGKRLATIAARDSERQRPYAQCAQAQRERFNLPA